MNIQNIYKVSKGKIYLTLSFTLWLVEEYVTVWQDKFNELEHRA